MAREIEDVVAEMFPHERRDNRLPHCIEGRCHCGASRRRAKMLAAIQMHVDKKTGGRVYLDRR